MPSRDPLSRLPCLTRRERCQPFLSFVGTSSMKLEARRRVASVGVRLHHANVARGIGRACLASIQPNCARRPVSSRLEHILAPYSNETRRTFSDSVASWVRATLRKGQLLFIFLSSPRLCVHHNAPHCTSVINYPSESPCDLMVDPVPIHVEPPCFEGSGK